MAALPSTATQLGITVLRLSLGAMWTSHALLKLLVFTLPGTAKYFASIGFPAILAYPVFAAEFGAQTWAQFFLKFILSHPAVTAVIPGTDKPEYMLDNLQAGRGPMPDAAMRKRIVAYWETL